MCHLLSKDFLLEQTSQINNSRFLLYDNFCINEAQNYIHEGDYNLPWTDSHGDTSPSYLDQCNISCLTYSWNQASSLELLASAIFTNIRRDKLNKQASMLVQERVATEKHRITAMRP